MWFFITIKYSDFIYNFIGKEVKSEFAFLKCSDNQFQPRRWRIQSKSHITVNYNTVSTGLWKKRGARGGDSNTFRVMVAVSTVKLYFTVSHWPLSRADDQ